MKKAIVMTLGVIIGVTGVLAICAHLADAAKLALYVPEDEDGENDEDIYHSSTGSQPKAAAWIAPVTGPAPAMELNWCANTVQSLVGT